MRYAFILRNKLVWPICVQCRVLAVSVSGYHQDQARRRKIASRRHLSDEALLVHIRAVYTENRGAYGWPRIWRKLRADGVRVGKRRVQRLMQQNAIRARGKRRFRIAATDSRHQLPIAANVLDRNFTASAPNQAWVGDFTYIATDTSRPRKAGCFFPSCSTCSAARSLAGRCVPICSAVWSSMRWRWHGWAAVPIEIRA